ncbi:MAG TPA: efflux RND transporter periplasmic adaptor subunit [Prolixibacteraceae bacterium]|nr:efflux RND transporter periplasmic adaptor subunit [Prolixibacteraceae bacterium]
MNRSVKNSAWVFISASLLLAAGCSSHQKKEDKQAVQAIQVIVANPETDANNGISASGTIESERTAQISTRIMGYITKIQVKVGDRVQKGQLLVTISDQDVRAKKAQAEASVNSANAALKVAEKDHDRYTTLFQQESASAKELENINLHFEAAKSGAEAAAQMLNEVNAMLAYSRILAPFSGTVTQKMADEGSMANPGMPILTIEQDGELQISASIPESEISKTRLGAIADVEVKSVNRKFQGEVIQISRSSQFSGGQYEVKISVPDQAAKGLFAGMYTTVFIPLEDSVTSESTSSVWVPEESLIRREQLTGLYTVNENNTAALHWVRTGKTDGKRVEIVSGLTAAEPFIVSAESKLYNGAPVQLRTN